MARKVPSMPVSSTSMATTNSRLRVLCKPMACGDSNVRKTINVVSSTSQSEIPSTPRWKWIPSEDTQERSTTI